jgi:ATP-dependent protease ClpP protease subunit
VINLIFSLLMFANGMGNPPPKKLFYVEEYCYLVGVIDFDSVKDTLDCLSKDKNSKLFISSPGGIVQAGELIIDHVNKNNTVVFCDSCYSMAAIIWLNAENREMHENSDFMMHYIWTYIRGPVTITSLRKLADKLESYSEQFLNCLDQSQKSYFIFKMKKGDFWFTKQTVDLLFLDYTLVRMP